MLPNLRKVSLVLLLLTTTCGMTLAAGTQAPDPPDTPELVDINSAPADEIQQVVQDEALATRIVEGRPYANKRQLLSRKLVTSEMYEKIKDQIVARRVQETP